MAVLRHERAVRPARGAPAAVVPARHRGPGVVGRRLRARRVGPVRARRRGPRRHREHGAPAEPERVSRSSRSSSASPGSCASPRRPAPRRRAWSRTCTGYIALAHERPAGEVLYAFLRGSGWLARLAAAETVAAEEALSNIARFFDIVRAQSALLADDRAVFFARHLQTLIEAGDDPPTADIDPDADAVAVMTVHKAKGLEFPVVYLPGLVTGRFPATGRREPLAPAARARQRDAARGRLPAPGGASPVLRRHDAGPRRARALPRRGLRRPAGAARVAVRARGARPAGRGRCAGRGRASDVAAGAPGRDGADRRRPPGRVARAATSPSCSRSTRSTTT